MKTVRDACQLQPNALSIKLSDQIEQLDELITAEGDGAAFFEKTHITQGMQDLISEGIARLAGASSQAVFHLKQAMGGGKTHLLVGFGLLAKHPGAAQDVLRGHAARIGFRERRHRRLQRPQQPRPLLLGRDRQPARQGRAVQGVLDERPEGAGREGLAQALRGRRARPHPARRDAALFPLPRHPEGRERHGRRHRHARVRQPAHRGRQEEERLRRRLRSRGRL